MQSVRIPNFSPTISGFPFPNSQKAFPAGTGVITITIPVINATIPLGGASNGMCGGMTYAVMDFYLAAPRLRVPPSRALPVATPLTNYILRRLIDSFALQQGPYSNALKYIDLMSLLDHDTGISPGEGHFFTYYEWPRIKADLDIGRPSPLGLVPPPWYPSTNISARIKLLTHCHQVLAYGYDLDDQGNLTLWVYDPNDPNDDASTISVNISKPGHTLTFSTPQITQNIKGGTTFRAVFRSDFYAPVVPDPGLSPGPFTSDLGVLWLLLL
jgi:hypothetical protein